MGLCLLRFSHPFCGSVSLPAVSGSFDDDGLFGFGDREQPRGAGEVTGTNRIALFGWMRHDGYMDVLLFFFK